MASEASDAPPVKTVRIGRVSSSFNGFTTVTSSSGTRTHSEYANLYDGPVPSVREQAQATHTAFVELHKALKKSAYHITASVFVKNMLALFLSVDKRAAILCYDASKTFNSICHPAHVPTTSEEFSRYFPRVYNSKGTITVKCRLTSSISILDIKKNLMDKLTSYNYYVRPTILQATRTAKAGWFYLAHPDLTHREEFQVHLPKLIEERFKSKIEFQVSPEKETVTVGKVKVAQRVLVLRCPYDALDKIRQFFMEAFSQNSQMEIRYLARYTFVPNHPIGSFTKSHLQAFLKMQQQFHKSVFWYNIFGLRDIDKYRKILPTNDSLAPITQSEIDDTTDEQMPHAADIEISVDNAHLRQEEEECMSLRMLLYSLEDPNGENLIHAVYPSNDSTKYFVLCSEQNKTETLQKLHHIKEIVEQIFEPAATSCYFEEGKDPGVQHYPKLTGKQATFVDSLVDLTGEVAANPQEEDSPSQKAVTYADMVSPSPTKRQRNGAQKHPPPSYLPEGFSTQNKRDTEITSNLNETMARLKQMESNDLETKESLDFLSRRLDQQGNDISTLGKSLQQTNVKVDKVCDTQVQQFSTMNQMNGSLSALLQQVSKLNEFNQQFSSINEAESPQGGGVGSP